MKLNHLLKVSTLLSLIFILFIGDTILAQTPAGVVYHTAAVRRRTAVVVHSATQAQDQQQAAAASAAASASAASASASAASAAAATPAPVQNTTPPPASTETKLPLGAVVTKLPSGCVSRAIGGEEYYQCGANYYKAAYQEGTVVYMTVKPPQ